MGDREFGEPAGGGVVAALLGAAVSRTPADDDVAGERRAVGVARYGLATAVDVGHLDVAHSGRPTDRGDRRTADEPMVSGVQDGGRALREGRPSRGWCAEHPVDDHGEVRPGGMLPRSFTPTAPSAPGGPPDASK